MNCRAAFCTLALPFLAAFVCGQATSERDALKALQAKLDQDSAAGRFSGVVLVARNGSPVFEKAYGHSDNAHGAPNKLETQFNLGSNNKLFTSVAILQLAEQGKLSLTATVGRYLPDYPDKAVASKVTIEELLTHRGATGDFFGPEFEAHRLELRTTSDYVKRFSKLGLQGEPGGRPAYSNYGYILLGAIIERVSGEDYYHYVESHICKPAGMRDTWFPTIDEIGPKQATGYTAAPAGGLVPNTDTLPYRGTAAGGGYSTAEDQLRFLNALQENRLLSAHSMKLLTLGEATRPGGPAFPLGMGSSRVNGARYYGHAGGAPGVSADFEFSPETGYTIIVLANRDPMLATDIAKFARALLPSK